MRLTAEISGDQQINHELLAITDRALNATPVWEAIMIDLEHVERGQFDSEGGDASGGWQQLSDSWLAYKTRNGYDTRILRMTGALFDSLTSGTADYAVREITPLGFTFGTTRPHAGVHQRGSRDGRVPQRKFLELTQERREAYVRSLLGWVRTGNPLPYLKRRGA